MIQTLKYSHITIQFLEKIQGLMTLLNVRDSQPFLLCSLEKPKSQFYRGKIHRPFDDLEVSIYCLLSGIQTNTWQATWKGAFRKRCAETDIIPSRAPTARGLLYYIYIQGSGSVGSIILATSIRTTRIRT